MANPNMTALGALRRYWRYLKPHLRIASSAFVAGVLGAGFVVAAPFPLKLIVDAVLGKDAPPSLLAPLFSHLSPPQSVIVLSLAAALLAAVAAALSALEKTLNARLRERMTLDLRIAALDRILLLTPLCRSGDRSGELGLRLVDDVSQVARLFSKTFPLVVRHLATTLLTLGAMVWISPLLGALGLIIVFALAVMVRRAAAPLSGTARGKRRQEGLVAAFAQDVLRILPSVQAASAERAIRKRFAEINRHSLRAGVAETIAVTQLERVMQIANGIAVAAILGGGGLLALRGQLSIGDLTLIALYLSQLLKPVEKINELASAIVGATTRAARLSELLDRPIALPSDGAFVASRVEGRIELDRVAFAYDAHRRFDFGSLSIAPGAFVSVEGPSGGGKSTLIALLLRLFDPSHGQLRLDGVRYSDWSVEPLRQQFAVSLQSSHLLSGSFRDALTFGSDASDSARLWATLERVALASLVKMRGGLDAEIGEAGMTLSGGQQARLALARALVSLRPILILDEPLANIDAQSAALILRALAAEKRQRTIVVVTHQSLPAGLADVELWVENGTLGCKADARKRAST